MRLKGVVQNALANRRARLAWRMTSLFVVFAVTLLITVGVLLIGLSFRAQRAAVMRTQSEIAKQAALEVSTFLATVQQGLVIVARTHNLADLPPASQQHVLAQVIEALPTFEEIAYVDVSGRERAKVSPYHTFTPDELGSRSDDPGFRQALRGETYLGQVTVSGYSGQPMVLLALPVADLRQETVGVVMAYVNFHRLWTMVTGIQVGQNGYVYVVDERGRLIAHREISPVLRYEDLSGLPTVAAFLQGQNITAEYRGLTGQRVIGALAPIAGTPWAVVAEVPTSEAYAGLYRMVWGLGVLLLGAIGVAIAAGRSLAGHIVRPIEVLQAGAAAFGAGNLDHTIQLSTGDELQALAEAFNTMARNLRRSREEIERWNRELESLVAQQTAALQSANRQLKALVRVSQSITAALALPDVLEAVAEASRSVLGADRCAVYLLDEERDELRCVWARGLSPAYVQVVSQVYRDIPGGAVIAQRQPLVIRDAANDPRLAPIQEQIRHEGYHSVVLLPLAHGDESLGMLAFYHETERDYSPNDLELAQTFANQAAIAIKNARLFDAVTRRAAELSALYAIATTVSQSLHLNQVLEGAVNEVLRLMQADVGFIYLVDEEMEDLTLRAFGGPDGTANLVRSRLRFGEGVIGQVAQTGQSLLLADVTAPPDQTFLPPDVRSFAGVPLQARGRVVGVLGLASCGHRRFMPHELKLLHSIGQQVGIAVENARLYDQSREVAVLEERNRLAREIHDTLAQGLTGIVIQLEAAERLAGRQPERMAACLERAKQLARRSLEEARRSLWNLRPTPLEGRSLEDALREEVNRLNEQEGLEAHLVVRGQVPKLPTGDEVHLYRIVQEALTNVRRHARASRVVVELAAEETAIRLTVADDGIGGVTLGSRSGFGLVNMRERASLLDGELHIESPPGGGTRVVVRVPLKEKKSGQPAEGKGEMAHETHPRTTG